MEIKKNWKLNDTVMPEDLNRIEGNIERLENSQPDENFSTADKLKLQNIEAGAQVNKIETIKVNNSPVSVSNKAVNISVPAATVISNSLNNSSTTEALSAAQGKELKLLISAEERKRQQKDTEHENAIAEETRNRKSANENLVNLLTQKNTELQNIISEMKRKKESEDMSIENRLIELTTAIKRLQSDDDPANYIVEEITYSKSWRVPSGVRQVDVFLCGGGSGGGTLQFYCAKYTPKGKIVNVSTFIHHTNGTYSPSRIGGKGGECIYIEKYPVTPNSYITCEIGAGGMEQNNKPTGGGVTKFGNLCASGGYMNQCAINCGDKTIEEYMFGETIYYGKTGSICKLNGKIYGSNGNCKCGQTGANSGAGGDMPHTDSSASSGYSGIIVIRYKRP